MHVDDVVERIFQRLSIRQAHGAGPDKSMSLTELRLAPGVTDASSRRHYGCSASRVTIGLTTRLGTALRSGGTGASGASGSLAELRARGCDGAPA